MRAVLMRVVSYTLLIVESKVIARAIDRLRIAGLEVLPTAGYAWYPEINRSTGKLTARANPEQLPFRTQLRNKAQLATRIVIATDADPSGHFIAHAICRFLKHDPRIRFTQLGSLDQVALQEALELAVVQNPSRSNTLQRYFVALNLLQHSVSRNAGGYSLAFMLAVAAWHNQQTTSDFSSEDGELYVRSIQGTHTMQQGAFTVRSAAVPFNPNTPVVYPAVTTPLSTAFLPYSPEASFEHTQHSLNALFAFSSDEIEGSLISYPRTSSCAYYESTWNELSRQLIQQNGTGHILPAPMRPIQKKEDGHEALHILRSDHTPRRLRPYLKRRELQLYTLLYSNTLAALQYPASVTHERCLTDRQQNLYICNEMSAATSITKLIPLLSVSSFMQQLLDTGWIKSSTIGNTMDAILKTGEFEIIQKPLPHIRFSGTKAVQRLLPFALTLSETARKLREWYLLDEDSAGQSIPAEYKKALFD